MFHYISIIGDARTPAQSHFVRHVSSQLLTRQTGWLKAYDADGLAVFCSDIRPGSLDVYQLEHTRGVVLGTLFERRADACDDPPASHAHFDEAESKCIIDSQGRRLIDAYWGNYVAFLVDKSRGRQLVLKDPTGSLPCMRIEHAGMQLVFSCIEDCLAVSLVHFTINWSSVVDYLASGWTTAAARPLNELDEIARGECIQIDSSSNQVTQRTLYWKPSTFADTPEPLEDATAAARTLRGTVQHCTRSWATGHENLLVRLSGGLDSSIVLGCLSSRGSKTHAKITCLTYYGSNAGSDPRRWARLAARHAGTELIEVQIDAPRTSFEPLLDAAPTPAPVWLLSHYLASKIERDSLLKHDVTATVTGDGGDSGFGRLSVGRAIDEAIQKHGFGIDTIRLAARIAAIRDSTTARILVAALKRQAFGSRFQDNSQRFEKLGQLISPEVRRRALDHDRYPHPWFSEEVGVPWGLIYRLGSLLTRPEFYDPFYAPAERRSLRVSPLYSQPVLELCLRIPLYLHFLEGRDRGLARAAFTAEVPEEILRRQWKDRGANTNSQLVSQNLAFLRALLVDGTLVREGLLDRHGLERALSPTPTKSPGDLTVLLHYMHIELWVRAWTTRALRRVA